MPELAAHLERELAELNQRLDGSNRCETCGHWRNDHAMDLVGEHFCEHSEGTGTDCCNCQSYVGVVPPSYAELVLTLRGAAAALAACAREAKLEQASELEYALLAARNFVRGRHSTLTYGPRSLLEKLDIVLLQITKLRLEVTGERAVGESKCPS